MTTRTYYLPKNRIALHVINYMIEHVGCSIGDIKKTENAIRVPITCNDCDIKKIERILNCYGLMED